MSHQTNIKRIIEGNAQIAAFWANSDGWAPEKAAQLMSKSRLDWQVDLSKALQLWTFENFTAGQLILAWANLGALVEGTLKLFLAVYYEDYSADGLTNKKGKLEEPDGLALEKIKQFFAKNEIISPKWLKFIDHIQQRRNAIHAFKDRPIGDHHDYQNYVGLYLEFLLSINGRLPYPDSMHEPEKKGSVPFI